ncbi:MAG: YdcF family protein [Candidatus Solibacter sp.]|nr:YdcF family protein [Candidatus Solibacter sp.]
MKKLAAIVVLAVALPLATYVVALSKEIERRSLIDDSESSDVIVVLGAAEYNGRPSPVLKARLDHAYSLYERGLAPKLITTGGAGGDPQFTEGQVGRDYLVKLGVPSEDIVVEEEGDSTVHTVVAVSEIMRRMGLSSAIVVSDGYHIFRVRKILEHQGMKVSGSPRPHAPQSGTRERWLYVRQAVGYLLWRAGINI